MRISSVVGRAVQVNGPGLATNYQGRRQSWNRFGERVARLAAALVELGVKPGDRVGMLGLNRDGDLA